MGKVKSALVLVGVLSLLLLVAACTGDQGEKGPQGDTGAIGAQGPQGIVGPEGDPGEPGPLPPDYPRELDVALAVSAPANGTHLVAGERATVTVTLADQLGRALTPADFSTLALYMYGPQETTKTVTAVKLLNATADRSKTPHHYIDLLKNTDVKVNGNVLTYALQAVSDEEPGTYTATVRAVSKLGDSARVFPLADFQLGTATVEAQIVEKEKCATCHLGASNGQFYLHHTDVSGRSPYGNPEIDSWPVRTCKSCHNNDGYAAYRGDVNNPSASTDVRTPDPIVRRVHGVHFGEELKNPFNNDPKTGNFKDYIEVVFPKDVRNCTACHADDRWKTAPSRLACTACHDAIWFGEAATMPATFEAHPGGPQASDANCSVCHTSADSGALAIPVVHKVDPPPFKHKVELSMSSPANGKFYVAGEKPTVTITVKDVATGAVIDPKTMVEPADATKPQGNEFRRGYLFVSGPRDRTMPVLTAAAAKVGPTSAIAGTYANNDFRVLKDAAKMDPRFTRTATSITYQLDDVKGLKPGTYTVWVETLPGPTGAMGGWQLMNFQVGTETVEPKIATNCTQCHGDTRMHASFFAVEFNTDICKSCHDYQRQITGKTKWSENNWGYGAQPIVKRVHGVHFGHYLDKPLDVYGNPASFDASKIIFPQDVRNCVKCHSETNTWKENPSQLACLACHDSDEAIGHATLQTINPTPGLADYGDEVETCAVCHGAGREFSPDKVHNIWDPFKPPYPREAD